MGHHEAFTFSPWFSLTDKRLYYFHFMTTPRALFIEGHRREDHPWDLSRLQIRPVNKYHSFRYSSPREPAPRTPRGYARVPRVTKQKGCSSPCVSFGRTWTRPVFPSRDRETERYRFLRREKVERRESSRHLAAAKGSFALPRFYRLETHPFSTR